MREKNLFEIFRSKKNPWNQRFATLEQVFSYILTKHHFLTHHLVWWQSQNFLNF